MRPIKIASRASKLALVQSNHICTLLRQLRPGVEISIVHVSTKGDRDKSDFLYKSQSVGFFTSEVENAILNGAADMAVHSLKDLPTAVTPGLVVAAIPKRESVADALVATVKAKALEDLPAGATVGTSSLRRIAQLHHFRNDLKCVPLRGNVETRLNKVKTGHLDAIIVAQAALNRLGLADMACAVLAPDKFLPAPAQGALAVQVRTEDTELAEFVAQLDDDYSRITAEAERHILAAMHGGCSIPLGAYAQIQGNTITACAVVCDLAGKKYVKRSKAGHIREAKTIAENLAQELLANGGQQILDQIRNGTSDDAPPATGD